METIADTYRLSTSTFCCVDGARVHYVRAGVGPTAVLLHGSGSSVHSFLPIIERLADAHDVIALDLPGSGFSDPRPDRDYRVDSLVPFVLRVLDTIGVKDFDLVGNSFGGNLAWNLALDATDRVRRLVLINATGYPDKQLPAAMRLARNPVLRPLARRPGPRAGTARGLAAIVGPDGRHILTDELVDRVHALSNIPANRRAFVDLANTDQPDRTADLPDLRPPLLVLRSENLDGQHFTVDVPDAREVVFAGAGHLLPEEHPVAVGAAIAAFLSSQPVGSQRHTREADQPVLDYFVAPGETRALSTAFGTYVQLSDGMTHYRLAGPESGELVVLVGGLTIPLDYWESFTDRLHAHGFRTLAYSAYGRGRSERVVGHYDEALFVRQLRELIHAVVGATRYHLLGTSMGALVAMASAVHEPSSIASLTIIGPAGMLPRSPLPTWLARHDARLRSFGRLLGRRVLLQHLGHNVANDELQRELIDMVASAFRYPGSLYAFVATLRDFPLASRQSLYRRIQATGIPAHVVWGELDRVTPLAALPDVRHLLQPLTCEVVAGCGHMAAYERPEQVAAHLSGLLSRSGESA